MSLERTNPLETDDGNDSNRQKTTAFSGGLPPDDLGATRGGEALQVDQLDLAVEIGGEATLDRSFAPGDVLVGRRPGNDISIDGEGLKVVSGHHMRFAFEGGRWCVEDKASTNGTFLNGVRVAGLQAVRSGDVVELGRPRKVGSYRSVKLIVSLPNRPAVDVTGTSDAVDLEFTIVPDDAGRPDETAMAPSEATTPTTDDAIDAASGSEELLHTIVGALGLPASEDASPATPVPASKPEDLRALIEKVQEKSRRLGEVSYRLDTHVADLASALVERHDALALADIDGGKAVVDRLDERANKSERAKTLEAELPLAQARLAEELEPLDAEALARKEAAEALSVRLEEASARRDETAAALDGLLGALTTSLRESLGPVVDAVVLDGLPKPATGTSAEPVWQHWADALASGAEAIQAREEELETARAAAEEASTDATSVEADSAAATKAWDEAKQRADEQRTSGEKANVGMDAELAEARARLAELEDELASAAKDFVLGLLSGEGDPPARLAALAGMDEARALAGEAVEIRSELADLERHGA